MDSRDKQLHKNSQRKTDTAQSHNPPVAIGCVFELPNNAQIRLDRGRETKWPKVQHVQKIIDLESGFRIKNK
jgi:hypothetical protein